MDTEVSTVEKRYMQYEKQYEFEYRLFSSGEEEYSIEAIIRSFDGVTEYGAVVRDVTRHREDAERMFFQISDGLVSPMTLLDVVYDMIA